MMKCVITSTQTTTIFNNIKSIKLPSFYGVVQILPNHAEAFFILKKGVLVLLELDKNKKNIFIEGGECFVKDNKIIITL